MDRKELETILNGSFREECSKRGYPLEDLCLEAAYPGDNSTSFIVNIVAKWIEELGCSRGLDILIDVLWDTVAPKIRKYVFVIHVYDERESLHCLSKENIITVVEQWKDTEVGLL